MKDKRYLFICAYAQSRSKYMAEEFMKMGYMSMFCGYLDDADFKITKEHIEWADTIILLCKHIERTIHYSYIVEGAEIYDKHLIKHYIDDEPSTFNKELTNLTTTLLTKKNE